MNSNAMPRTFSGSRPRVLARRSRSAPARLREDPSNAQVTAFRARVWGYWKESGRHDLPWRKTKDPYRILVSEVMLQQTQVPRVIGKYGEFLKAFPTVRALARASLADVLKIWSGLGYNRRGKYLHDAAKQIVEVGNMKKALAHPLPGVGPYTRAAVRVFAFNEPDVLIETNIRTAYIHNFYSSVLQKTAIADKQIIPVATIAAEGQDPRKWHWALMDYGAYLKRSGVRNNSRSAHYTKQSKFEGSLRQVRGAILRELHSGSITGPSIYVLIRANKKIVERALEGLARDGLILKKKGAAQRAASPEASGRRARSDRVSRRSLPGGRSGGLRKNKGRSNFVHFFFVSERREHSFYWLTFAVVRYVAQPR